MRRLLLLLAVSVLLTSCTQEAENPLGCGGAEVIENPLGRTVTVNGGVATLVLTATYRVGVAVIQVSLTNNSRVDLVPALVGTPGNYYCYLTRVLNDNGDTLRSEPFGLDEFEEQFDSGVLAPGLTYTEYEYVTPLEIPNDPTKGKFRADVWLAKRDAPPDTLHHIWVLVDFQLPDD